MWYLAFHPIVSAPGPDGFSGHFFTSCWDIIHLDIFNAVLDFFKLSTLPRAYTSSFLVLIPHGAVEKAKAIKDFRPISLCNLIYKIIARLFNDRLASILPLIISENQGAFVKGRNILENISLAQELTQEFNRKCYGHNVIIKLDMGKAYDRLEWDFLFQVLLRFGFHPGWVNYIRAMFTNCWFSVLYNGGVHGFFKSTRGLRQGDPLASSLFILAQEVLSRGLTTLLDHGLVKAYHGPRGCPAISHLLFADDTIIFTNGSKASLTNLLRFLSKYEEASGQKINRGKSGFLMYKKTHPSRVAIVSQITGFIRKELPIHYLGVPLFVGAPRSAYFQVLLERIRRKISHWKCHQLSKGGRIVLLQSVLLSMPIYLLSVLTPPATVLQRLNRIFRNFLWGAKKDNILL